MACLYTIPNFLIDVNDFDSCPSVFSCYFMHLVFWYSPPHPYFLPVEAEEELEVTREKQILSWTKNGERQVYS